MNSSWNNMNSTCYEPDEDKNRTDVDWEKVAQHAAEDGILDMFKYSQKRIIHKQGDYWYLLSFVYIASGGNKEKRCLEIIKYCAGLLGNDFPIDSIESSTSIAIRSGNFEIVKFLISIGSNEWNTFAKEASYIGNLDMLQFFEQRGANDFDGFARNAALGGHMDIILHVGNRSEIDWDECAINAACKGDITIFKFSRDQLSRVGNKGKISWNTCVKMAMLRGHIDFLESVYNSSHRVDDWNLCYKFASSAISDSSEYKDKVMNLIASYCAP